MHLEASNALSIIKNEMKNASLEARPVAWKNCKKWSFFENVEKMFENWLLNYQKVSNQLFV